MIAAGELVARSRACVLLLSGHPNEPREFHQEVLQAPFKECGATSDTLSLPPAHFRDSDDAKWAPQDRAGDVATRSN